MIPGGPIVAEGVILCSNLKSNISQLMASPDEPERPRRRIRFQVREKKKKYRRQKIAGRKGNIN